MNKFIILRIRRDSAAVANNLPDLLLLLSVGRKLPLFTYLHNIFTRRFDFLFSTMKNNKLDSYAYSARNPRGWLAIRLPANCRMISRYEIITQPYLYKKTSIGF